MSSQENSQNHSSKGFRFQYRGYFIQGEFRIPQDVNGDWLAKSPADFSDELGRVSYSYSMIDEAVASARKAFRAWRQIPFSDRAEYLKKFQLLLKKREKDFAEVIAREVGKPLWEANTEVGAMINKVDITLNESMKFVSDFHIPNIMENTDGYCRHRPLGVMAVLGPFNFPGHLPNGHFIPALATGNTVVFKPSEKTPFTGQWIAELFAEAGLPPGVFNLVQGEKEVGRRLSTHEEVDGVLFTGSYEVGTRIKQDTLQQHWKLLALEMGGKNASIIDETADLNHALYETLLSSFLTTGQRCSATSRVFIHESLFGPFTKAFHERAKAFVIGHPLESPFMGPLIEQGAMDRYMKFIGIAAREGFEMMMRGKILELAHKGNYVAPSICTAPSMTLEQAKKSVYQQTELFGPNVAIIGYQDLEEALEIVNETQYGLVTSVFSKNASVYEKCFNSLEMGLINWNKSTVGASSRLPFGGLKKSGNHFPTALTSTRYCTYSVSSLEVKTPGDITSLAMKTPGLNWETV